MLVRLALALDAVADAVGRAGTGAIRNASLSVDTDASRRCWPSVVVGAPSSSSSSSSCCCGSRVAGVAVGRRRAAGVCVGAEGRCCRPRSIHVCTHVGRSVAYCVVIAAVGVVERRLGGDGDVALCDGDGESVVEVCFCCCCGAVRNTRARHRLPIDRSAGGRNNVAHLGGDLGTLDGERVRQRRRRRAFPYDANDAAGRRVIVAVRSGRAESVRNSAGLGK